MRSAYYEQAGHPSETIIIGDMNTPPDPSAGEVLIRVGAGGVNPVDYKMLMRGANLDTLIRIIPLSDGSGVIEAVGEGVSSDRIGQRVWTYGPVAARTYGMAAEYSVLLAENTVPLPNEFSMQDGACMGIPVLTAHYGVFAAGPVEGQTVLVHGGAGGVGGYAIQLAKWGQATTVITTVSSAEKADFAKTSGADHIINYREQDFAERVLEITDGDGVDLICDVALGVNIDGNAQIIKKFGTITAYAPGPDRNPRIPWDPLYRKSIVLRPFVVFNIPPIQFKQAITDASQALADGALTHTITSFPLEQTADALALMMSGDLAGGKIVVNVADL